MGKLHIRGPFAPLGGQGLALWQCYDPNNVHQCVSAVSPMVAYRTWHSIYNTKPLERLA